MKKYYRICQQNIELFTELPVDGAEEWEAFEIDKCEPDIIIHCVAKNRLPERRGEYYNSVNDFCVCSADRAIERRFVAGSADAAVARYEVSEKPECEVTVANDMWDAIMDRRYLWTVAALPDLLSMRKAILVHASYVDVGGEGIIFSAPCGTGKSTQAALWEKYRHAKIINGDKCGITVADNRAIVHGLPFAGTSGICFNKSLPLKAVVILKQAPQNNAKRLTGATAVKALLENVYHDNAVAAEQNLLVSNALDLSENTPVYELACTPDERAIIEVEKVMFSTKNH